MPLIETYDVISTFAVASHYSPLWSSITLWVIWLTWHNFQIVNWVVDYADVGYSTTVCLYPLETQCNNSAAALWWNGPVSRRPQQSLEAAWVSHVFEILFGVARPLFFLNALLWNYFYVKSDYKILRNFTRFPWSWNNYLGASTHASEKTASALFYERHLEVWTFITLFRSITVGLNVGNIRKYFVEY